MTKKLKILIAMTTFNTFLIIIFYSFNKLINLYSLLGFYIFYSNIALYLVILDSNLLNLFLLEYYNYIIIFVLLDFIRLILIIFSKTKKDLTPNHKTIKKLIYFLIVLIKIVILIIFYFFVFK